MYRNLLVFCFLAPTALLAGCSLTSGSENIADLSAEHAIIIAEIESSIALPPEADAIERYARHYAFDDESAVVAAYLIPSSVSPIEHGCSVMLEDFRSRPCSPEELADLRKHDEELRNGQGLAGQVIWHHSGDDFPVRLDGGCRYISIKYDRDTKSFETLECNGSA